ncbi:N-6 DNA methylase [Peptoniphilus gorbachii]|uniref:site-specific DNA-methyltransferase (adenine-specific) n=1 Tax=Peptoniphilus gorbachii TaxID=411567 RepID=A0ABS2MIU2_9FIRM|nr:N-6 DNA methylase [Peptoniphilus gorbachii]MBM7549939.1 type I restriction enzyme M protein [Peptoniphilus gorbachii]
MAKKTTKKAAEKALNIDNILFNCRDILRAARNSGSFFEKRDMMLTLVFLRFIGEKYEDGIENLRQTLIEQGLDPDDEDIRTAFFDDATFADGTYNLPVEARWSTIINTPAPNLNVVLDTALHSIATTSKDLKGCFIEGTFTSRNLGANDIKKLVDEVNKISHKAFGEEKDLIGHVYEYFLKEFAVNATKEEGEFYTPHDVVQLIASMIEPYDGTLYDPACGSGGMFIQSAELVKSKQGSISSVNVYGQEKEPATYRLAKMNLALRGISHHLGGMSDSSFINDLHKGLYFDYIMANPPFNLKGWYDENLQNDARWADYVTPPESNANYAWILHMLSHLKKSNGVAGFLLANGALNDSDTLEIRKRLIQNDKVEAIIVLPRELFITTDISVTLWILNQNKKCGNYHGRDLRNREHEILFMDLRTWTENPVKRQNKKKVFLSSNDSKGTDDIIINLTGQIERASSIYHTWQNEGTDGKNYEMPELYRSVGIKEIESKDWALTPSKYIEFIDHDMDIDYEKEMSRIQAEMQDIMKAEKKSQQMLEEAFRGIGYGID